MLTVSVFVSNSKIHGMGVFAAGDIPKGSLVWTFVSGFDKVYPKDHPNKLSKNEAIWFKDKAYLWEDKWYLDGDDAKFINHSDTPNIGVLDSGDMVALRDISDGEEITSNYKEYHQGDMW